MQENAILALAAQIVFESDNSYLGNPMRRLTLQPQKCNGVTLVPAHFRGLRRDQIVPHSQIKRPDTADYHGGYADELHEGYAKPVEV